MKRLSVRLSVRLSFHSSTTATAAGGFAAERPAAANASSFTLTTDVGG